MPVKTLIKTKNDDTIVSDSKYKGVYAWKGETRGRKIVFGKV